VIDRDTGRLRFDLPRPSHNGGIVPVLALPSRILVKSKSSSFRSCPTNTLVPEVTVTGRAVLSRIVRQGTPKYVVSSSIPPESVTHDCMCIGSLTPARDRNMLDGSQKRNRGSNPASPRSQDSAGLRRFLERGLTNPPCEVVVRNHRYATVESALKSLRGRHCPDGHDLR
jgi:hypothetical protein